MKNLEELIKKTKTLSVLYAEDEVDVREQSVRFFQHFFDHIVITENGEKAWEAFQKEKFDILIADLQMPLMSGNELINNVKKADPNVFIIAMSGISGDNGVKYSADVKIRKPVTIETFEQALTQMLESKQ